MKVRKVFAAVLCLILAAGLPAVSGCGREKGEDETQIKKLVKETPAPTVQPEADNPDNTKTKDGVFMTNDYLNQKEAGQVPTIADNKNVTPEEENGEKGDAGGSAEDGSGDEE